MIADLEYSDPEYLAAYLRHGRGPTVLVDGRPIYCCQFADTEAGIAIVPKLDAQDSFVFDAQKGDWVFETLHGTVELSWEIEQISLRKNGVAVINTRT